MVRSIALGAAAVAALASVSHGAVTIVDSFRNYTARASLGPFDGPTVVNLTNSTAAPGLYAPGPQIANVVLDTNTANGTVNHTSNIDAASALFSATMAGSAAVTNANTQDAQARGDTAFTVRFTVDAPMTMTILGNVAGTRTGNGSVISRLSFSDSSLPFGSQLTILGEFTSNAQGSAAVDRSFSLVPGPTYSISASVMTNVNRIFSTGSGAANGAVDFVVRVPTPAAASLLGFAGIFAARRRR